MHTLTQSLNINDSLITFLQDLPCHPHTIALTTSPVSPASELDAFDLDPDDATTLTSNEQSIATEVVIWNFYDEHEVRI